MASYGCTEVLSKLTGDCHMALANACRGNGLAEEEVVWQDWSLAKSHITGQLAMKLHLWSVIPWRLCGLAHQAASAASLAAQAALRQWDAAMQHGARPEDQHALSRLFCDPLGAYRKLVE